MTFDPQVLLAAKRAKAAALTGTQALGLINSAAEGSRRGLTLRELAGSPAS